MVEASIVEEKTSVVKEAWSTERRVDELFLELDNDSLQSSSESSDYNISYQEVTESDEIHFENFMRHKPCPECGHDHSFKPSFNDIQTSIDRTSELISSFFNGV